MESTGLNTSVRKFCFPRARLEFGDIRAIFFLLAPVWDAGSRIVRCSIRNPGATDQRLTAQIDEQMKRSTLILSYPLSLK